MRYVLKNILLYSALLGLIVACETPPKVEGVWVVAYTIDTKGQKEHTAQKLLFDFDADSLKIVEIGNQQTGEVNGTHISEEAFLQKNPWRYIAVSEDSSDFILSHVSKDSLVLSSSYYSERIVLKPLPKHLHKPYTYANLIGKVFKAEVPGISHQIDFIDSTFMINTLGDYSEKIKWSLVSYKGYQFLNTNSFYLLQALSHETTGKIILTNQYIGTNANTYVRMAPKYQKEQLYGSWRWIKSENAPPDIDEQNPKRGLEISKDFLIKSFKVKAPMDWQLGNDGSLIYFSSRSLNGYKILDLTDSTMVLQPCCDAFSNDVKTYYERLRQD